MLQVTHPAARERQCWWTARTRWARSRWTCPASAPTSTQATATSGSARPRRRPSLRIPHGLLLGSRGGAHHPEANETKLQSSHVPGSPGAAVGSPRLPHAAPGQALAQAGQPAQAAQRPPCPAAQQRKPFPSYMRSEMYAVLMSGGRAGRGIPVGGAGGAGRAGAARDLARLPPGAPALPSRKRGSCPLCRPCCVQPVGRARRHPPLGRDSARLASYWDAALLP